MYSKLKLIDTLKPHWVKITSIPIDFQNQIFFRLNDILIIVR